MILELKQLKFRDQHGVRVGYVFTGGEFAEVRTSDRDGFRELSAALEWCGGSEAVRHPADWPYRGMGRAQLHLEAYRDA